MSAQPVEFPRPGVGPSVLLVGRDASLQAAARLALEPSIACHAARTAAEAAAAAAQAPPSVCFVTADPDDETRVVAELSAAIPYAPIVVLTRRVNLDELIGSVRAGAVGYLPGDADLGRLPNVVRGVLQGEAAIPRSLVPRLVDELRERRERRVMLLESRRAVDLTGREWEVLEELRRQATTKEIAQRLSISEVTVRRHISRLLQKLGVEDRRAAVELVENWRYV